MIATDLVRLCPRFLLALLPLPVLYRIYGWVVRTARPTERDAMNPQCSAAMGKIIASTLHPLRAWLPVRWVQGAWYNKGPKLSIGVTVEAVYEDGSRQVMQHIEPSNEEETP